MTRQTGRQGDATDIAKGPTTAGRHGALGFCAEGLRNRAGRKATMQRWCPYPAISPRQYPFLEVPCVRYSRMSHVGSVGRPGSILGFAHPFTDTSPRLVWAHPIPSARGTRWLASVSLPWRQEIPLPSTPALTGRQDGDGLAAASKHRDSRRLTYISPGLGASSMHMCCIHPFGGVCACSGKTTHLLGHILANGMLLVRSCDGADNRAHVSGALLNAMDQLSSAC